MATKRLGKHFIPHLRCLKGQTLIQNKPSILEGCFFESFEKPYSVGSFAFYLFYIKRSDAAEKVLGNKRRVWYNKKYRISERNGRRMNYGHRRIEKQN